MNETRMLGIAALVLAGCGGPEPQVDVTSSAVKPPLDVVFGSCDEIAGIGLVPAANARAVVPAGLTPAAGDPTHGIIVVRVAHCLSTSVAGKATGAGTVAQIGISLVPPDGTGDINNFTFIYHTDNKKLAQKLGTYGVRAEHVPGLQYNLQLNPAGTAGTLHVGSPQAGEVFAVDGTINVPTGPFVPFTANWWDEAHGNQGLAKMSTPIPAITFGAAAMTLTTPAGSGLATLIGATSLTFPFLDSYNVFPAATMTVSIVP